MWKPLIFLFLAYYVYACPSSYKSPIGNGENINAPQFKVNPHFQLTDAHISNRGSYTTYASISLDGTKVYAVPYGPPWQINNISGTPQQALFLTNSAGLLTITDTIYANSGSGAYNYTTLAAASRDFTFFLLNDHQSYPPFDEGYNPNNLRVRIISTALSVTATRYFPDFPYDTDAIAPIASFTDDNSFVGLCLDILPYYDSNLFILNTNDLSTFIQLSLNEYTSYNVSCGGVYFFSLYDCTYPGCTNIDYVAVSLDLIEGIYDEGYDYIASQVLIFRFNRTGDGSLLQVAELDMPNTVSDFRSIPYNLPRTYVDRGKSIRFLINTLRADLEDEVVAIQPNLSVISFLPNDGQEVRVYEFFSSVGFSSIPSVTFVELVASDNAAQDVQGGSLNPKDGGNSLIVVFNPEPTFYDDSVGVDEYYDDLDDLKAGNELVPKQITCLNNNTVSFPFFPPQIVNIDQSFAVGDNSYSVQFDLAGNWLIVGADMGSQNYDPDDGTINGGFFNALLLFNVSYYVF